MNETEDLIHRRLTAEFDLGSAIAMDPANDAAIESGGKATTTLTSYWLLQPCPVCQHTFRLGDEVLIANGTVLHNSALLPCAQGEVSAPRSLQTTAAFFDGLDETWPPPEDIPIVRLNIRHKLLADPSGHFRRHRCAVCGHTFRENDHVVICPCSPNQPLCQTAIHRDPLHGLHCLEAWNPGANKQHYCPVTSRKLHE